MIFVQQVGLCLICDEFLCLFFSGPSVIFLVAKLSQYQLLCKFWKTDRLLTMFFRYFSIVEEIQSKSNVENEFFFEIDVVKLKLEIISQCEKRIHHLSDIIQKNVETILQKMRSGINADHIKYDIYLLYYLLCLVIYPLF